MNSELAQLTHLKIHFQYKYIFGSFNVNCLFTSIIRFPFPPLVIAPYNVRPISNRKLSRNLHNTVVRELQYRFALTSEAPSIYIEHSLPILLDTIKRLLSESE